MNLKAVVAKEVVPHFKAIGLELRDSYPVLFRFQNADHSIMIKLYANNHPSQSKLISLINRNFQGDSRLPSTLHIEYSVFIDSFVYRIFPHQIICSSSSLYHDQIFYTNERELSAALLGFVEQVRAVLPILQSLVAHSVFVNTELYSRLQGTEHIRASRFLLTHNLPDIANETSRILFDTYLSKLIIQNSNNRKNYFLSHIEDFVDAAAYLGEIVSCKCSGRWDWYQNDVSPVPYLIKLPELDKYSALDYMFDPLSIIIESWNTFGISKQNFIMDSDLNPLFY